MVRHSQCRRWRLSSRARELVRPVRSRVGARGRRSPARPRTTSTPAGGCSSATRPARRRPTSTTRRWKPVTLPHAWNEDAAFKVSIEQLPTGIAWYRKRFTLPAGRRGQEGLPRVRGRPPRRRRLPQRPTRRPARERRDGVRDRRDRPRASPARTRTSSPSASTTPGRSRRRRRTPASSGATATSTPTTAASTRASSCTSRTSCTRRCRCSATSARPASTSTRPTSTSPGKAATITAESQVRNDHDAPRTFTYEVVLSDMRRQGAQALRRRCTGHARRR